MKVRPPPPRLPLLAVLAAAVAVRWWLLASVDLRDFPGAAGGQALADAAAGALHRSWEAWLIGLAAPLTGDIGAAAHLVGAASSVAMVLGTGLGGAALCGWRGALAGMVVAGVWSQALLIGMLVGPDPPAVGAAWLGVGLSWWAGRRGGIFALLAAPGAALVVFGATIKEIALPAAALLIAVPIVGRGWGRLTAALAAALGGLCAAEVLQPGGLRHAAPHSASPLDGLAAILAMVRGWPDGLLEQLIGAAILGGLLPGPRWGARALCAAVSLATLGLTATQLGGRLCPRLLLGAGFGVVVMLAVLAVHLTPRRLVGVVLIGGGLSLDSLAWLDAWSTERTAYAGAAPLDLPAPPSLWAVRYTGASYQANNGRLRDLTTAGGVTLAALSAEGIGLPPLRDRRDEVVGALAALSGTPSALLHPRLCCADTEEGCAARLVAELDAAGMVLVTPRPDAHEPMLDRPFIAWRDALVAAAEEAGGLVAEGRWWVRRPTGSGGAVPCVRD